ncbi:hypothetical protein JTE90_006156 [Oedothorax gibbosus]|uniref:Ankyrin repeat and fibronectin type-III domain-containing protein 1 n=1 Tax=Oedothorax gibbosus TaxID=931172 RepID=A0AAV6U4Q0_9ARAC|nr:hypothetical protein JTE90_006156 [Oedothorax gibbosus]
MRRVFVKKTLLMVRKSFDTRLLPAERNKGGFRCNLNWRSGHLEKPPSKKKPPLLRARTLPAIICPSLNIIQAQLEADASRNGEDQECFEGKPRRHFSGSSTLKAKNVSQERERCYLDPDFEPAKSPMGSPRASVTSVTSCTSIISAQSMGRDASKQKYEISKAGLARFAKRLTSKDKSSHNKAFHQFPSTIPNIEVTPLRRSGSVDSLLESNLYSGSDCGSNCSSMACLAAPSSSYNLSSSSPSHTLSVPSETEGGRSVIPTSPSVPAKLEAHRRGDIPSSPSVPNKLTKGLSGQCLENPEVLLEGLPLSKAERKRLEKLNKINIDLQALYVSVEHEHLERARSILATTDVNVNCVNSDGFTPLDIAVMILDISMAKLLQSYGARESTRFRTRESKLGQLLSLVKEAERCVDELTTCVLSAATAGTLSMALLKEKEKQLTLWRRRQTLLWRMRSGFEKLKVPGAPASVTLEVVGTKAIKVKFTEGESASEPETIVTKYKVEWSVRPDFHPLSGSREMMNLQQLEMVLGDLIHGVPYCVRVAAGNCKGYSPYTQANPPSAAPSSWMDVSGRKSRSMGRLCQLDCVFHQIIFTRPPCSSEIKDILFGTSLETPQQQRRQVRKSIKNLFMPTPKFQKNMKRGVYLACLMYTDHRVLVTTEDTLPVMEVDESCPGSLHNDFHWLMKVACTWEDTKVLRAEMEKTQSSSAVHFRGKLLQAAEMMQAALGVQDLGQLYYKPIKDLDDTTVLCSVKHVPDSKSLNNLSLRWVPLAKLQRKLSVNSDTARDSCTVNGLLLSATQAMMAYNHMSRIPLPKGLYVAYVKISSSVDLIRILVPKKAPNVLPYYKVRENPHVSEEEWFWLKHLSSETKGNPSAPQLKFQKSMSSAIKNLLTLLEVPPEQTCDHRIYESEVIELNSEVSLILLLPPVDSVCSAPGQKDDVADRTDCVLLPLQIFEMIHMSTYQHTFISRYSRISSILEMDTIVAQHIHRQAFSTTELSSAKSRLRQLQQFQAQVDNTWRSMRWLMDVLNFAREKHSPGGVLLSGVLVSSGSPQISPQHYTSSQPLVLHTLQHYTSSQPLVLHTLQVPCEVPSFPPSTTPAIRITNSSSSYSLNEPPTKRTLSTDDYALKPNVEMRRCVSTSRLVSSGHDEDEEPMTSSRGKKESVSRNAVPPSTLQLLEDGSKAYSSETLSVTYKIGTGGQAGSPNSYGTTPVNEDEEGSEKVFGDEDTLSHDGIVINITPGCGDSLSSSNDNPDMEDFEDISGYKEQQMDEFLQLPNDDNSRELPSEDEDSLTDCGLQFRPIPTAEAELDVTDESEDYTFVTKFLDSEKSCPDDYDDSDCPPDEVRVTVAYHPSLPPDTIVRLTVSSDATAREIVDAVVGQVNEAALDGRHDSAVYRSDQTRSDVCLVASFDETERFLSDSFQPLKVQNPWTKGHLLAKQRPDCEE